MNKVEFIDMLRRHISEVGDPAFVNDTIDYYQDYIDTAIRKGSSEEDVLAGLGDPRLIAKSIVASRDDTVDGSYTESGYGSDDRSDGRAYGYGGFGEDGYGEPRGTGIYDGKLHIVTRKGRDIAVPMGIVRLGGVLAGIMLLVIAGKIAVALSPVIGVAILAWLLYRFFRDNF